MKHENSINSRYFNGLLMSGAIEKYSVVQYVALLKKLNLFELRKLPLFINGVGYKLNQGNDLLFNANGEITEATFETPTKIRLKNGLDITTTFYKEEQDGSTLVQPSNSTFMYHGRELRVGYSVIGDPRDGTRFDKDGNLVSTELRGWHEFPSKIGPLKFAGHVDFHPNGTIKTGTVFVAIEDLDKWAALERSTDIWIETDLAPGFWIAVLNDKGEVKRLVTGSRGYRINSNGLPN
jgi:hypothetical protein